MSDNAARSIELYLEQLRSSLEGEDPAVAQDALYDAEEYLRAEVAAHPDKSEADVLEFIAASYGAPEEVADAYRNTEAQVRKALEPPRIPIAETAIGRYFNIMRNPRSYSSLFYMILSLATGIFYFTVVVTGSSMSVGLAILIIGIPFFLLFVGTVRVLSLVEGRIVETLLGVRMPRRPVYTEKQLPLPERIMNMLKDVRTWTTMLYMLLLLPLGIAYFTAAVTAVAVPLGLVAGSIIDLLRAAGALQFDSNITFITHDMPIWLVPLFGLLGIVLIPAALWLFKGIGIVHGHVAKSLLVQSGRTV